MGVYTLGMSLNIQKCHSKSFYRSRCPIVFDYKIGGSKLECAQETVKDLGVTVDAKLTFYSYIQYSSCKALTIQLFKVFLNVFCVQYKLVSPIKSLHCALVPSVLYNDSVLRDPYTARHSYLLERPQRKFLSVTSHLLKIDHQLHDYSPVLARLQLPSLADRRVQANIDFLNTLLSDKIDSTTLLSHINFKIPSFSPRNDYPFQ